MGKPTTGQICEFARKIEAGQATDQNFQQYLDDPDRTREAHFPEWNRHGYLYQDLLPEPISDSELARRFPDILPGWRRMARDEEHDDDPLAWRVKSGFRFKDHAPEAGPWEKRRRDPLQDLELANDTPTPEGIVFWIPVPLRYAIPKEAREERYRGSSSYYGDFEEAAPQLEALTAVRQRYRLPEHHLTGFGSASLLCALAYAYLKHTGKPLPTDIVDKVRTDTSVIGQGTPTRITLGSMKRNAPHLLDCSTLPDVRQPGFMRSAKAFAIGIELAK